MSNIHYKNTSDFYLKCDILFLQSWPLTLDTDDLTKKKLPGVYRAPTAEMLAYLDFSVSTTGMLAGN